MPPKKSARVGTQLLVDSPLRDRARALAVVGQKSVADVWRDSINLGPQEKQFGADLKRLEALIARLDVDTTWALGWMVDKGINFDVLEKDDATLTLMVKAYRGEG